jgi:hypothetical protein
MGDGMFSGAQRYRGAGIVIENIRVDVLVNAQALKAWFDHESPGTPRIRFARQNFGKPSISA